jgi:D-xylose transport system substrate-binding protein
MKLFSRQGKSFAFLTSILLFTLVLASCGSANNGGGSGSSGSTPTASTGANGKGCTKIGVLLPETATSARWDGVDRPDLEKDIPATLPGATIDYYNAQGDAPTQQNQADQALTKGDCILVVAPKDSGAAAAIVTKAKSQNVPVIAYDRIIQSKALSYYVSFDSRTGW